MQHSSYFRKLLDNLPPVVKGGTAFTLGTPKGLAACESKLRDAILQGTFRPGRDIAVRKQNQARERLVGHMVLMGARKCRS